MPTSKYIDLPLDLTKGVPLQKDESVVVQRVRILLTTEPGDMMDKPNYGTPLKRFLYEGITEASVQFMKMTIRNSLTTWMADQVEIDGIDIQANNDAHTIVVLLNLHLIEFNKNATVVEKFKM